MYYIIYQNIHLFMGIIYTNISKYTYTYYNISKYTFYILIYILIYQNIHLFMGIIIQLLLKF
jgi:hypothetical protein